MSFRFWRRVKILPGVTLNLSKSGGSLSFGPRGAKLTLGSHGKRATLGLPGTGLFYTTNLSGNKGTSSKGITSVTFNSSSVSSTDRLALGFFKRLITPPDEQALVDGCRELVLGDEEQALTLLNRSTHLADGAYLSGFLALKKGDFHKASALLTIAEHKHAQLNHFFKKYGISALMSLPISAEITVHVRPDLSGVLLGLVEVFQQQKQWKRAEECLERLRQLDPQDAVVKLSLAELLVEAYPADKQVSQQIVQLAEGIENESAVHAALFLYKAKALRSLGFSSAARDTLTAAMRRKKNRSDKLLRALRYERAQTYEELRQKARARSEFEKIYVEAPTYEDVAERLGLF